jgi:hypothetical protein
LVLSQITRDSGGLSRNNLIDVDTETIRALEEGQTKNAGDYEIEVERERSIDKVSDHISRVYSCS